MKRRQTLYLQNGAVEKPSVRISKTSDGVMFAVHATGRSLNLARIRAEKAYRALAEFCRQMEKE
jgi:hypothetical protein